MVPVYSQQSWKYKLYNKYQNRGFLNARVPKHFKALVNFRALVHFNVPSPSSFPGFKLQFFLEFQALVDCKALRQALSLITSHSASLQLANCRRRPNRSDPSCFSSKAEACLSLVCREAIFTSAIFTETQFTPTPSLFFG